jgi:hypothetical protein
MTDTDAPRLTIGELESKYYLYRKALKMLLIEGSSLKKVQKTLCWSRLETLHTCLPRRYRSPDHLFHQLNREIEKERVPSDAPEAAKPEEWMSGKKV